MSQFMFATGIKNSYPTIEWKGKTIHQDELAKAKHYHRWRDDFVSCGNLESSTCGMEHRTFRRIPGQVSTIGASWTKRTMLSGSRTRSCSVTCTPCMLQTVLVASI